MCDYSLAHFPNRLAVEGERLRVHQFSTRTLGLAPVRRTFENILFPETTPAVCVPPGARLELRGIPEHLQWQLKVSAVENVTFVQLSADAYRHRDAVRFRNGREILLQCLQRGQRLVVLSVESAGPESGLAEASVVQWQGQESD